MNFFVNLGLKWKNLGGSSLAVGDDDSPWGRRGEARRNEDDDDRLVMSHLTVFLPAVTSCVSNWLPSLGLVYRTDKR